MKKHLLSLFCTLVSFATFAQTVTLTFTAKDAGNHYVQLNRVAITNLTKSWQETIFWPDTVLIMQNGTGVEDYIVSDGFSLSQNNPNPFSRTTDVSLTVAEAGAVTLEISDVNGHIVETQNLASLQPGMHQFHITLSTAGTYIMTARQNGQTSSIKMVCYGGGGANNIDYLGIVQTITYVLKSSTNNPFNFGDMMEYVGYAIINGAEVESQRITQAQGASQTFTLQFAETQYQVPSVITNTVSDITPFSAIVGGTVTNDGGAMVTTRGVCWSTSHNPTVSGNHTDDGTGIGSFTSNITNLATSTTYYVRAYATNNIGTAYGNEVSFTTNAKPAVTTSTVNDITATTATCGGNVSSDGGATVTARGVCWSTSHNPTVSGNHTDDGTGIGSFTSNITNLSAGTTYYVRAYATNSAGTAYGNEVSFTTNTAPVVTTTSVSDVTATTATSGGNVTSDGGATVIARGVCWSTNQDPTIANNHSTDGCGDGSFTSVISGLMVGTTYYVRAYATNAVGTAYGNQVSFTTGLIDGQPCLGTTIVSDIDGNDYNTVQIGQQCWMKENLRTTHYTDGTSIPFGQIYDGPYHNIDNMNNFPRYYYPYFDTNSVPSLGLSYNLKAVMRFYTRDIFSEYNQSQQDIYNTYIQGICPTGWHIPSYYEYQQLKDYLHNNNSYWCDNNSYNVAKSLAATSGWISSNYTCSVGNNLSTNNATGFSALPTLNNGKETLFWSSSPCLDYTVNYGYYGMGLYHQSVSPTLGCSEATSKYSIRCIRDENTSFQRITTITNITNITSYSATISYDVFFSESTNIIEHGLCWSTSHWPTLSESNLVIGSSLGSVSSGITGLNPFTTYYVRAYAITANDTTYSSEVYFKTTTGTQDGQPCPANATVVDYDGNVYNTVQIGLQCWMKENLRTTHYANSVPIAQGDNVSGSVTVGYWYATSNVQNGLLYNWKAVMGNDASSETNPSGVQGICPAGWHVPSLSEWQQLMDYVRSQDSYVCGSDSPNSPGIAKALASTVGWSHYNYDSQMCSPFNNPSTNNATGFSARYSAYWYSGTGSLSSSSDKTSFWSSTSISVTNNVYSFQMGGAGGEVTLSMPHSKTNGYSVRCLRD